MAINLNSAYSYAVFACTTIQNVDPTTITGTLHVNDSVSSTAKTDLINAYNNCVASIPTTVLSGSSYILTTQTLNAGVYSIGSSLEINGTITLSGSSTDQFIFQIGSTLTMDSASVIALGGSAIVSNVFWQVGSSATLESGSTFLGFVLANTSITAITGATVNGGLLAINGAVTLDMNTITDSPIPCYVKGTRILTTTGYKNIEDIVVGEEVYNFGNIIDNEFVTKLDGSSNTQKVIFNGHFTKSHLTVQSKPIVFKTGSLGINIPFRAIE